jgi:iron complex outermembrane receptor protein
VSQGNTALRPETSDSWSAGFVWSPAFAKNAGWSDGITVSLDYFDLQIDDAVQGRDPAAVVIACVETLDPFFCDFVPRLASGKIDLVDNQLQNIGSVETSGFDIAVNYVGPETRLGQFSVDVNATHLNEYIERTLKTDGSFFSSDKTGTHTFETFARAFPDWRAVTTVDWNKDRWSANLAFRWADEMVMPDGCIMESSMFTDLQVRYVPKFAADALTLVVGFNNLFDETPVNIPCEIGPSRVLHDLPGTVGYVRVTYQKD